MFGQEVTITFGQYAGKTGILTKWIEANWYEVKVNDKLVLYHFMEFTLNKTKGIYVNVTT